MVSINHPCREFVNLHQEVLGQTVSASSENGLISIPIHTIFPADFRNLHFHTFPFA
jgi:hypothetical protein